MGQCRSLDADITTGCYHGDYSSCENIISMSFIIWNKFFSLTNVCLISLIMDVLDCDCLSCACT